MLEHGSNLVEEADDGIADEDYLEDEVLRESEEEGFEFPTSGKIRPRSLGWKAFEYALARLPRLKNVVFTDWRGLSKPDETYDECAARLWGDMLAPTRINPYNHSTATTFLSLIEALSNTPMTQLRSLAIGPHRFEENTFSDAYGGRHPIYIHEIKFSDENLPHIKQVFSKLHSLRLPFTVYNRLTGTWRSGNWGGGIREALQSATLLRRLTLEIRDSIPRKTLVDTDPTAPFEWFVRDLHFPYLELLDLRGWVMPEASFRGVLERHSSTLRELRLVDCVLEGNAMVMGNWAAENLNLTGVELDVGMATSRMQTTWWTFLLDNMVVLDEEDEALWLAGRSNAIMKEQIRERLEDSAEGTHDWFVQRRLP